MHFMVKWNSIFDNSILNINLILIFKAKNPNDQVIYGLGYSTSTSYTTTLFAGPLYNSYQIQIFVQVYDNNGAFTIYDIMTPITVVPDFTNFESIKDKLISADPIFSTNVILNQGSYLNNIQIIQSIASLLNIQSYSDKLGAILNKSSIAFPQIYGPMADYAGVNAVIKWFILFIKITTLK